MKLGQQSAYILKANCIHIHGFSLVAALHDDQVTDGQRRHAAGAGAVIIIEIQEALVRRVVPRHVGHIGTAVIGGLQLVLGVVIIRKAIFAGLMWNLIYQQSVQLVARLRMLRFNITASFEALICILLDVAESTTYVKVCVVNCLHIFHQL